MSNSVRTLEDKDFELQNINPKLIGDKSLAILFIKADWCGYCTRYIPTFEQYSTQMKDVAFFILESTENEKKLEQWQNLQSPAFPIEGFPTLVFYGPNGSPLRRVEDRFNLDKEAIEVLTTLK